MVGVTIVLDGGSGEWGCHFDHHSQIFVRDSNLSDPFGGGSLDRASGSGPESS